LQKSNDKLQEELRPLLAEEALIEEESESSEEDSNESDKD
jgi:hypothetical protein